MNKILSQIILFPLLLIANSDDIQFDYISVEDGLSSSYAKRIIQDSSGFMWIGTGNGLNKYDGYNFKIFEHIPYDSSTISDNIINALSFDKFGYLWIGTETGGINRFDPRTDSVIHFKNIPDNNSSLSSNCILSICNDSQDNIWIGTSGRGLNLLADISNLNNKASIKFKHFVHETDNLNSIAGNTIRCIFEDSKKRIWIGTDNGISKIEMDDKKQIKIKNYLHNKSDPNSISNNDIRSICEDINGDLWVGTYGGGVNKFNTDTEKFYHFIYKYEDHSSLSTNKVSKIMIDKINPNILWIGTYSSGINRLNINTGEIKRFEATGNDYFLHLKNYVLDIFQDKSGLIWIAGYIGGVYKFDPYRNKFFKYQPGLGKGKVDIIWDIYINPNSEDIVWLASAGGGLLKFDKNSNRFTRYLTDLNHPNYIKRNQILCIHGQPKINDPSKTILWLGYAGGGLIKFDSETNNFKFYIDDQNHILSKINYRIRSIYSDPLLKNITWFGTFWGGIFKYDRKKSTFKQYTFQEGNHQSLGHPNVHDILRDSNNELWICTLGSGLNKMNEEDETFVHYKHNPDDPTSINYNRVNIIFESKAGELWIGTREGLNKLDRRNNSFIHFTEKDGLSGHVIRGILEDRNNNLWVSTNNGLTVFNPKGKGKISFKNFDEGDGLHGKEFINKAYFKDKKGKMYFGGIKGFTVFDPTEIKNNTFIPNVLLTNLLINNKTITPGKDPPLEKLISYTRNIKLEYYQNNLTFEFAALDYLNSSKNKYAYKLDGVNSDWIYTDASNRLANYTQLNPGEYIFRVKGSNNDGIWNENGSSINITILPPWWRTNWAYSFYAIMIILIIGAIWYMQLRRIRLKHQYEIEHMQAEKLVEMDQVKSRFFANISHEFRTPLTLILEPLQTVITKVKDIKIKNELKLVNRNATRLKRLVNQLLDISRLEAGKMELKVQKMDVITILRKIVLSFASLAERKQIKLKFQSHYKSLTIYIDLDKIDKIFNNLLSNALKFTGEGGKVLVKVSNDTYYNHEENEQSLKNNSKKEVYKYLKISASNTGFGIPSDQIDKIFDRFYQVNNLNIDEEPGTGIGLALTKELVELHHGKIEVKCRGKGIQSSTIFTVYLPLGSEQYTENEIGSTPMSKVKARENMHTDEILESDAPFESSVIEGTKPDKNSLPWVLLIEDNADMRTYIFDNLINEYNVLLAKNGQKGCEIAKKKIPGLIISDVMMPIMDGYEVCKTIKSDIISSHIPVILLTARADIKDKLVGLELGADDYIPKPFSMEELKSRIRNLIEQRQKLRDRYSKEALFGINNLSFNQTDEKFLENIIEKIDQNIDNPIFTVQKLSDEIGINRMSLNQKLKALTGQTAHNFIRLHRLKKAAILLNQKTINVTEVVYAVGYRSLSHFTKAFQKQFDTIPSKYSNH